MTTNKNGMTLVELVVATTVIAIIIVLIMSFLVGKIVTIAQASAQADLSLKTQLTLDIINRDIKQSADVEGQNIWADNYAPSAPANLYSWQSSGNTAILAHPAEDGNGNILYEDPKTYVSYKDDFIFFVSNNTLYKRTLAAQVSGNKSKTTCPAGTQNCPADIKLTDNVTSFTVSYYDANDNLVQPSSARSIGISLTVSKTEFGKTLSITQTIRTVFRNR